MAILQVFKVPLWDLDRYTPAQIEAMCDHIDQLTEGG